MSSLLLALFTPFIILGAIVGLYHLFGGGKKYRQLEAGYVEKTPEEEFHLMTTDEQNDYGIYLTELVKDAIANGLNKVTIKYGPKTPAIDPYFITMLTFQTGKTLLYNEERDGYTISILM